MEATKAEEDSSIQRMIRLVRSADAGKARIVGIADRWATWIVVIALTAAALTWMISGELIRAVTILVVFCPCAMVLATPTAIMAAIGNATRHGFLVREGDALERLASAGYITFDKTGTLTYGTPQVVAVHSFKDELTEHELYTYAASAELRSEHPLGKAVVRCFKKNIKPEIPEPEQFSMLPGRGVKAMLSGTHVIAGNLELLSENQIPVPESAGDNIKQYLDEGCTVIMLAVDEEPAGFIALADTLRDSAARTILGVKQAGVTPVLLTGDNENAARHIGGQLHIDEIRANCLPEDKLIWIDSYQKQEKQVCMIGDGINDAPALKKACVGIAMGGVGSDIAVDAADIVLVNDDIREIPYLFYLAKRMMITIKCNLAFSLSLNFIAIVLAITGILNPVVGALVHNAGSVAVILNSAVLLTWKKMKRNPPRGLWGTPSFCKIKQKAVIFCRRECEKYVHKKKKLPITGATGPRATVSRISFSSPAVMTNGNPCFCSMHPTERIQRFWMLARDLDFCDLARERGISGDCSGPECRDAAVCPGKCQTGRS